MHLPRKPIENQSITRRLTASLVITVLIVSVIAVTAMHWVVSQAGIRSMESKADDTLAFLTGTLEIPLWAVEDDVVKAIGKAVSNDESVVRLTVRNEEGRVVYSLQKKYSGDLVNRSGRILHKQADQEHPIGDVSVSLTPAIYNESNRRLLVFSMLIIVLILIAVAIVTILFIRTSLDRPLKSLNEITRRFASGIYNTSGQTLPYLEFQPFGRAMADMAGKIEGQIRIVREAEEGIRKLNAELQESNEKLELELAERKRAGEALRESRQFLNNIVANSPGAIYRSANDSEWTMEFLSDAITRITGFPADDFIDNRVRSYASIIHRDDRRSVEDAVAAGLARQDHYNMEYRLVAADGTLRWVHEQGRGVLSQDGKLLYLDGVIVDITAHREAEEQIRKLNEELEQRVAERTKELDEKCGELERLNRLFVGRELRMVELKQRIAELEEGGIRR